MRGQSPKRPCKASGVATTFCPPGRRAEGSLPGQLPGFSYQWLHHTLISKALTEHLASHIPSRVTMLETAAGLTAGHKLAGHEAERCDYPRPQRAGPTPRFPAPPLRTLLLMCGCPGGEIQSLSALGHGHRGSLATGRERQGDRGQSRGLRGLGGQIK